MKLTAKIIPIDLRRRRALERAHALEIKAARATFGLRDAGHEPQPFGWPKSNGSQQRVTVLKPRTEKPEGAAS
jgi:hypothetical protein